MKYLSTAEVAKILNVHPRTVRRMIDRGELKAIRVGKLIRIPIEGNSILEVCK